MNKSSLPTIGSPLQGGFFAGTFQLAGELYALICSPKAGDLDRAAWHPTYADIVGAASFCDGMANTNAMIGAECPHALAVRNLSIGEFADWYLPSRDELEMLYRAFKPTADSNYVYRHGENPSSVPPGYPYTSALPMQTPAEDFHEGAAEAFESAWYWSSTQCSRTYAWGQDFGDGFQGSNDKSYEGRARAVRRFKVQ